MINMLKMTIEQFKALPVEVQEKAKDRLTSYDSVTITFEHGQYRFGTLIKREYAADHKVIGTIESSDIFTADEMVLNYVNDFHDYPIGYEGNRDYSIFSDAVMNVTKFKYDDKGNIVKA